MVLNRLPGSGVAVEPSLKTAGLLQALSFHFCSNNPGTNKISLGVFLIIIGTVLFPFVGISATSLTGLPLYCLGI